MSLCGLQFQILLENHIGTRAHPLPLLSCHKEKGSDEILQESKVPNQIYLDFRAEPFTPGIPPKDTSPEECEHLDS